MNDKKSLPGKPSPSRTNARTDEITIPPQAGRVHAPAAAPHPGRIGDYAVLSVLGEGGMGTVYLAEDARLGRKAAIKTMKPALAAVPANRERFLREARAAAAVEHDNIVPIWQVGEADDGSPFIAMPFLQGESLADRLGREPVSSLGLVLKAAREVADGLAAAHARGLIHRDIKPANVWVEGDLGAKDPAQQVRRCKILDFGLARSDGKEESQLTANGAILGTPAFMAPEQAYGEKVDARADLFSLGVMLYRMATGKLPFKGNCVIATLASLATFDPPPARSVNKAVPHAVSDLIERLMCKDREGRPQSAAEVGAEVRQIAKDLQAKKGAADTAVIPPPPRRKAEEPAKKAKRAARKAERNWVPLIIGAAALLVVLPLGAWLAISAFRNKEKDPVAAPKEGDGKPTPVKPVEPPKVEPPKVVPAVPGDPDRRAAEWVLSIGGKVKIDGENREIRTVAELGAGGFRLTSFDLQDNKKADDAGMAAFQGCKSLAAAYLKGTAVGDAGLAHLVDSTGLAFLDANGTQVGDASLARLNGCKKLWIVGLAGTKVTDAGLAHLADLKGMMHLNLTDTQVGDAGLDSLKDCKGLGELLLRGTKATAAKLEELKKALPKCKIEWDGVAGVPPAPDRKAAEWALSIGGDVHINFMGPGIKALADLPKDPFKLTLVGLHENKHVSDEALAPLQGCASLERIWLSKTQVGDAGLAHLKDCTHLLVLDAHTTKVTDAGLAHLKDCKRLWYLGLGYTKVSDAALVPLKDFPILDGLDLRDTAVTDAGMDHVKACKNLRELKLGKTKVTPAKIKELMTALPGCKIEWEGGMVEPAAIDDRKLAEYVLARPGGVGINDGPLYIYDAAKLPAGPIRLTRVWFQYGAGMDDASLAPLKACKNLTTLDLTSFKVTDDGLIHFKDLTSLTTVKLHCPLVTPAGLRHFRNCKGLRTIDLREMKFGDADMAVFKDFKDLMSFSLNEVPVGDAGLAHLKECKKLMLVKLEKTKVTAAGLADLSKAVPRCRYNWDVTQKGPKPGR